MTVITSDDRSGDTADSALTTYDCIATSVSAINIIMTVVVKILDVMMMNKMLEENRSTAIKS